MGWRTGLGHGNGNPIKVKPVKQVWLSLVLGAQLGVGISYSPNWRRCALRIVGEKAEGDPLSEPNMPLPKN